MYERDGKYVAQWTAADGSRKSSPWANKGDAAWAEDQGRLNSRRERKGLIDQQAAKLLDAAARPLAEHVNDWEARLISKRRSKEHAERCARIVRELVGIGGEARWLLDLDCQRVQSAIADRKSSGEWTSTTCNHAVVFFRAFGKWLHDFRRWYCNPFLHLDKLAVDDEEVRGAFTVPELVAILKAAEAGGIVMNVTGGYRAMLYRVALGTGERLGTIRQLTPESFVFDVDGAHVVLPATHRKQKKRQKKEIPGELGVLLKAWLVGKSKMQALFALPPQKCNVVRMLRKDMRAAGVPEFNADGEKRVFHSLRHSYVTLTGHATTVTIAQILAGHANISTTMRYFHASRIDEQRAVAALPMQIGAAMALQSGDKSGPELTKSDKVLHLVRKTKSPGKSRAFRGIFEMGRAGIEPATHGFSGP